MKRIHAFAALLLFSACTPTPAVRGNMLKDYQIATVQVGTDTQSDVLRKLGSPTTKAPFNDKIWFYMGQETEKHGPLDPKIKKEEIIQLTFNDQGQVSDLRNVTQKRTDIPYSRDKTPTTGNEITLPQQLLGNLGKFNKSGQGSGNVGSSQGGADGR